MGRTPQRNNNLRTRWGGWTTFLLVPGGLGMLLAKASVWISPESFVGLAPFGLLFPVFGVLLVSGTLIRLADGHWKSLMLPVVICILVWPEIQATWGGLQAANPQATSEVNVAKVVSWNVRQFNRYGWLDDSEVMAKILKCIHDETPDVLCLQEAYVRTGFLTRPELWSASGSANWHRNFGSAGDPSQHVGLATLTRHPILKSEDMWFDNDASSNACIVTDILIHRDTLRVFNVHFSSNRFDEADLEAVRRGPDADERARVWDRLKATWIRRALQARQVVEAVEASPYPVILAGDFNDGPVSYATHRIRRVLRDAFSVAGTGMGSTYVGRLPMLRIDYLMASPELVPEEFRTVDVSLSDHRPIAATFRW